MKSAKCDFCIEPAMDHCACVKYPTCKIHSKSESDSLRKRLAEISTKNLYANPFINFLKDESLESAQNCKSNFESINQICKRISNKHNINLDSVSSSVIEMKYCNYSKILAVLDIENVLSFWKLSDEFKLYENCLNRIKIQNNKCILSRNSYLFISSKYQFAGLLGDNKINLWYFTNYTKVIDIDLCYDYNQKIFLSSNEDFLIILKPKIIKILDLRDFSILAQIYNSFQSGFYFMTSINYLYVSAGFDENLLNIYNINNLPSFNTIRLPSQGTCCFILSENEELFASAFKNNKIHVWTLPFNNDYFLFEGHDQSIKFIKFTNDSLKLASGGLDDYINIWDLESKQLFKRIYIEYGCFLLEILDENRILVNGFNNDLKMYDIHNDFEFDVFDNHFDVISAICLSKSFKFFATGGHDHKIVVWNTQDWSFVSRSNAHEFCISAICFSSDDYYLFSTAKTSNIHMWDRETISFQRYFLCGESKISELFVNKDDKILVAVHKDEIIYFKLGVDQRYSIKITEYVGSIQYTSSNLNYSIFIDQFTFLFIPTIDRK